MTMRHFLATVIVLAFLVSWKDNADNEAGFIIERSVNRSAWVVIGQTGTNVTKLRDGALVSQSRYCYRVQAFNEAGTSKYSREACRKAR